jgi:cell division transport system ATP-binding protein
MSMIQFSNVSKIYNNEFSVLTDVSFSVVKGEFVFLTGESSSGKSTLLKHIYMDEFPTSGTVKVSTYDSDTIKKRDIPFLRRSLGIVFQDFRLLSDRSVFENIAFAMRVTGSHEHDVKSKVFEVLALIGLSNKADFMPHQISGGEQQQVCIARAIVNDPVLVLADEPTGNLDSMVSKEIVALFEKINSLGTTVIMTTYDKHFIAQYPHRTITLTKGRIAADTSARERITL